MPGELMTRQMREIVRMRHRHARADVVVHQRAWGIIVEARRGGHAIELRRFDWSGAVGDDERIALAA